MPVSTLQFSLPDEQRDLSAALAGRKALSVLWEINERIRSLLKHGSPTMAEAELAKEIRALIPADLLEL